MISAPVRLLSHALALFHPARSYAAYMRFILLLCLTMVGSGGAQAQSAAAGLTRYMAANSGGTVVESCASGCHGVNPGLASAGHLLASNNPNLIETSYTSGSMTGFFTITPADRFALSLYIGQFKSPVTSNSTIRTRVNNAGARNVYPLLATDGSSGVGQDSGGVTATNGTNGTTSVSVTAPTTTSLSYNITYTPSANFVGNDSFSYSVINPTGTGTSTISVTVVGITSAGTASIATGQAFSYQITTNGTPNGANPYSVTGSLPTGLSLDTATGLISGTPTASGTFNVTISAVTDDGSVSKGLTLTVAPIITSASSVNSTQGQALSYQITTNGTLSGTNPYNATGLPGGLSVNTATGVISGTPPLAASTNVTVSAVTTDGTASQVVAFNIAFAGAPVISSPTAVTATFNQAITPIQIVASNPPISSYAASGLPNGLSLDTATGIISGTPTQSGSFSVTLSATNGAGIGNLVVPFTIPVVGAATTLTVQLNSSATLDLAPFIAGTPTGVGISTQPAFGSVTVNGTQVTYTPRFNYFGSDSFSYVAFSGGLTSSAATITITIVGRPDPTQDTAVTGLVGAQAATARRFAGSQMGNFQRHLESLHRRGNAGRSGATNSSPGGASLTHPVTAASAINDFAKPLSANGALSRNPSSLEPLAASPTVASPFANLQVNDVSSRGQIKLADLGNVASTESAAIPFLRDALGFIGNRTLNLGSLAAQAAGGRDAGATSGPQTGLSSIWVEGNVQLGRRDATGNSSALDFSTDGVSTGIDYQINDSLILGVGAGYGYSTTNIGSDGTQNTAKGYSVTAYGSYQPSSNTFIDALLGVGMLDFNSKRYVSPLNQFTNSQRDGWQFFGSITGGYEYRNNGIVISPYLRLDYSANRLDQTSESGAGAYALTYFQQNSDALEGAIGLRAQSIHDTSFGLVEPRVRFEYRHNFLEEDSAQIAYADLPGTRYTLLGRVDARDSLVLGLGSDFAFNNGLKIGLEYQLQQYFSSNIDQAIRFNLSKDFDGGNLPKARLSSLAFTEPIDIQVEAGYQFDDNVSRARSDNDILSDSSYSGTVAKPLIFLPSNNTRTLLTFSLGGERFRTYEGLSRLTGGVQGEFNYRPSAAYDSPTLGVFLNVFGDAYESRLRDGFRYSAGASWLQPVTDRITLLGTVSHNQRYASSAVFETRDVAGRLNLDYAVTAGGVLYLSGEYRKGDFVSSGSAALETINISTVFTSDDAYPGRGLSVYRIDGKSTLATLGYNWSIGPRDALDFSWRRIESTPEQRPSFAVLPSSYVANQYAITYLMRF